MRKFSGEIFDASPTIRAMGREVSGPACVCVLPLY
jgi:hypothetical protein